jgi:hypothetical protein
MPHSTRYALGQLLYNRTGCPAMLPGAHIGDLMMTVQSGAGLIPQDGGYKTSGSDALRAPTVAVEITNPCNLMHLSQ